VQRHAEGRLRTALRFDLRFEVAGDQAVALALERFHAVGLQARGHPGAGLCVVGQWRGAGLGAQAGPAGRRPLAAAQQRWPQFGNAILLPAGQLAPVDGNPARTFAQQVGLRIAAAGGRCGVAGRIGLEDVLGRRRGTVRQRDRRRRAGRQHA
jgi:hypothetical protein